MIHVKVKITKSNIKLLSTKGIKDVKRALKGLRKGEHILSVQSITELKRQIEKHNNVIEKGIVLPSKELKTMTKRKPQKNIKQSKAEPKKMMENNIDWDYKKLNTSNRKKMIKAYRKEDFATIYKLHNDLKLSNSTYCCASYRQKALANIKYGIDNKLI